MDTHVSPADAAAWQESWDLQPRLRTGLAHVRLRGRAAIARNIRNHANLRP
jgi:hypothetical protein